MVLCCTETLVGAAYKFALEGDLPVQNQVDCENVDEVADRLSLALQAVSGECILL